MSLKTLKDINDLLDAGEVDSLDESLLAIQENILKTITKLDEIEANSTNPQVVSKLLNLARGYLNGSVTQR